MNQAHRDTLFVEDDTVIAEPQNAPRHPYGIYCVIRAGSSDSQKAEQVHKWVQSGTPYQEFLATNPSWKNRVVFIQDIFFY